MTMRRQSSEKEREREERKRKQYFKGLLRHSTITTNITVQPADPPLWKCKSNLWPGFARQIAALVSGRPREYRKADILYIPKL